MRWCERGPGASVLFRLSLWKLTDQQTGPFQYCAFVFEITQLTITTITHNRRVPEPGGGSNKHPIYLADYPGEALLFATWEGWFFLFVCFFLSGGGGVMLLQQSFYNREARKQKTWDQTTQRKYCYFKMLQGQHYLSSIFSLLYCCLVSFFFKHLKTYLAL